MTTTPAGPPRPTPHPPAAGSAPPPPAGRPAPIPAPPSAKPAPPPPSQPPSLVFTAGDGAMMAGRDIDNSRRTTRIGGGWGFVALIAVLVSGVGGGVYLATQSGKASVQNVGALPGEAGVRDTWNATSAAVRRGDGDTVCALMTLDLKAKIEGQTNTSCEEALGGTFATSEHASLQQAGSGELRDVDVRDRWAEVTEVPAGAQEPTYEYLERVGDRWRWSDQNLYAEFHPDACPEPSWNSLTERDPKCG